MKNEFEGKVFYQSTFDECTGTLVREVEVVKDRYNFVRDLFKNDDWKRREQLSELWRSKYGWRRGEAFSPSPETIDICITDWCNFGCDYCYMDSTTAQKHAPKSLVEDVIKSFDIPPYQIAIGGGEPTAHPDLPSILKTARELGVVPNYTTAGHIIRDDVIAATNEVCGGVAMTFHAFKGIEWFVEHYTKLRELLKVQLNVHLIADRNVAINLDLLTKAQDRTGKLNVVLLAFYPGVGRSGLVGLMPKAVYNVALPGAIQRAIESKMKIAFSEGLLPYFISRPELGVDTRFATRSEGLFSCYVDSHGRMSESSFNPPIKESELLTIRKPDFVDGSQEDYISSHWPTIYETRGQLQWNQGFNTHEPDGANCYDCAENRRCATPNVHHYFACRYAENNANNPPLTIKAQKELVWRQMMANWSAVEKERGGTIEFKEFKAICVERGWPFIDRSIDGSIDD